ncbi:MAG: 1,2-phenylacetyl-CoA epoxidase subunit B, partial [Chitinophagaceae bacterium]
MNLIRKFYYGDIPEEKGGGSNYQTKNDSASWPLWEVFIRSKQGLDHKHAGSLHAADAQMAIENARDVYTRR